LIKEPRRSWRDITPRDRARAREEAACDPIRLKLRLNIHQALQMSLGEGVDLLVKRAGKFFDLIAPDTVACNEQDSDRAVLLSALKLSEMILSAAWLSGRRDVTHLIVALRKGQRAIEDRNRGLDEELLRAKPRQRGKPPQSQKAMEEK